jgi:NADPH:quinone reductase-like Zn-dependent oxidoreductase
MKAVVALEYGPPEGLRVTEVPVPRPGPGQVQVRIAAAGLNLGDLHVLTGGADDLMPIRFPAVMGMDFAGTVSETGPGVSRFAVGDEVFGMTFTTAAEEIARTVSDPPAIGTGALAEYAVFQADTAGIAPRPAALPIHQAATLAIAGLTALPMLPPAGLLAGDTALVIGASGGIGSTLVSLLAKEKIHVIGTASGSDVEFVRRMGAVETIDYRNTDVAAETLRRCPSGVGAVFNAVMPGDSLAPVAKTVRSGGKLVNIVWPPPPPDLGVPVENVLSKANPGDLEQLAAWATEGLLPDTVSRSYSLADGAQAYVDLKNRHTTGKLVVVMD